MSKGIVLTTRLSLVIFLFYFGYLLHTKVNKTNVAVGRVPNEMNNSAAEAGFMDGLKLYFKKISPKPDEKISNITNVINKDASSIENVTDNDISSVAKVAGKDISIKDANPENDIANMNNVIHKVASRMENVTDEDSSMIKNITGIRAVHDVVVVAGSNARNNVVDGIFREKCSNETCRPPDCHCESYSPPSNLAPAQIPQMVMLSFDDSVHQKNRAILDKLFHKPRHNPNGCPIHATFFICDRIRDIDTEYNYIIDLVRQGHEIADHGVSHRFPSSWWKHASYKELYAEFNTQRDNFVTKLNISASEIRGMRIPFLQVNGSVLFSVAYDMGLVYDATCATNPHDNGGLWPYTLDYPPSGHLCQGLFGTEPKEPYPGLWEVPCNKWNGPGGYGVCISADYCKRDPKDEAEALDMMWSNFNRLYNSNRAPFTLHVHAKRISEIDGFVNALDRFLDGLTNMSDVYLITISQVIDWMRKPTTLKDIKSFKSWKTPCNTGKI